MANYPIEHIPGALNVVADVLQSPLDCMDTSCRLQTSIERIFRSGGENLLDGEDEDDIKEENEVNNDLEDKALTERFEIFSRYHN